jgi:hypothetical protein
MNPRSSAPDAPSPRGRDGDIVPPSIERNLESVEMTGDGLLVTWIGRQWNEAHKSSARW